MNLRVYFSSMVETSCDLNPHIMKESCDLKPLEHLMCENERIFSSMILYISMEDELGFFIGHLKE